MNNICPKCGTKLKLFYLKENCPSCGTNLLYYKLDERLESDAKEAKRQENKANRFVQILRTSSIGSPLTTVRLILFFLPLGTMCLNMYSDVSLISVIKDIIAGTFKADTHLLPVISMALIILLSLCVIISSLFSATKHGLIRNVIFSIINTLVLVAMAIVIGAPQIGWYLTLGIYIAEIALHFACNKKMKI